MMKRYKADDRWVIDTLTDTIVTSQNICDLLNENACELPAVDENVFVRNGVRYVAVQRIRAAQPRAMTSVEIAKKYGKGGYAFRHTTSVFTTAYFPSTEICGICLIDDLLEDVSRSPWFMPMVDESGNVTEVRCESK